MEIKIGMVAPTKAGKSSLLATTFSEMQLRLSGNTNGIQYWADSRQTQDAITRMMASYRAIMATDDDVFATPQMAGTAETRDYRFSYSIPVVGAPPQRLNVWFKDFPGGLVGMSDFANEVGPFVRESTVLLVPIPADILMELADTDGKGDQTCIRRNIAAACALRLNDTLAVIKDWVDHKTADQSESLLVFVPVRCEAYFNDNGGHSDRRDILFSAVEKFYINPLALSVDNRRHVQIEAHAVDTYGTVELKSVELVEGPDGDELDSTFRKRFSVGSDAPIRSKGAFDLLATISCFELKKSAKVLEMDITELARKIADRSLWTIIWEALFGSSAKRQQIQKMAANKSAYEAISVVSRLANQDEYRQQVYNKIME